MRPNTTLTTTRGIPVPPRPHVIARRSEYMHASPHREHLAAVDHFAAEWEARAYVEARGRGETPVAALREVRTERDVRAVLTRSDDDAGTPYNYPAVAWDVDTLELARVTAGPLQHVVMPDGTHPDGTVTLPPGATVRVYLYDGCDHVIDDDECYSPDDVAAWRADQWRFAGLAAVVTLANGDTGEAALWVVEVGDYWPGSTEAQVWHVTPDVIAEALADAMASTSDVSQALAEPLL